MLEKLFKLSKCFDKLGYKHLSDVIISLAAEISSGNIPDFEWIKAGSIFGVVASRYPDWFEDFINYNSNQLLGILKGARVIKFLGSGATGDAWLLSNGNVLKLFDANAKVRNFTGESKSTLDDAKIIEKMQWSGEADPSQPKIYDYGIFNYDGFEEEFRATKSPSRFTTGSFKPAYIIMEGVKTTESRLAEYIENNPEQMKTSLDIISSDELEDLEEIENLIKPNEVPQPLIQEYLDAVSSGEYEYFLYSFRKYMNEKIHEDISSVIFTAWDQWQEWNMMSEDEREQYADQEPYYDFNSNRDIQMLVRDAKDSIENSQWFDHQALSKYEEILRLPSRWDDKLIEAMIRNMKMGRTDVHGGNWGFRGNQPVFFDA